jgi:Uncharacterized conserved protein
MKYIDLSMTDCMDICNRVQSELGLNRQIVEKDWWVTTVLRALFALPYSSNLSFKGGTSLSKCWSLIDRFSEDVDIAVNREFLGFIGELTRTQINDKLRRAACSFVREKLQIDLKEKMISMGVDAGKFRVSINITPISTTDPEIIEIEYDSIFKELPYIKRKIKIEVSGRSMNEPTTDIPLCSMIDAVYKDAPFVETTFNVRTVLAERTFLEKIFLLHEEFAKPHNLIRTERMSRHLYDIVKIMDSPYAEHAILDKDLYSSVIDHRRIFIGLKGLDYSTLLPQKICIIPPKDVIGAWRKDYEAMCETMIYGESLPFDKLMTKISELNIRLNTMKY